MIKKILYLLFDSRSLRKLGSGMLFFVSMFFYSLPRFFRCRNKLCVCFDYNNGIYADFYVKIYKQVKERSHLEAVLLTKSVSPQWNYDERFELKDFIPQFLYRFLRKKIVIHAAALKPLYLTPQPNTRHIQMNHGFGSFVAVMGEDYVKNADMLFANTEHQMEQLKAGAVANNIRPKFLKPIGYPKIDGYVNEHANDRQEKRVESIFYGPTYHVEISSIFNFLEPLVQCCVCRGITLYVKLHPFLCRKFEHEKSGGIDWESRLQQISSQHKNVRIVPTFLSFSRVVKYFNEADIFLTDHSGFGYEYVLITGRPIVFLGDKLKIPLTDQPQLSQRSYDTCPEIYYRGRIGPTIKKAEKFNDEFEQIIHHRLYDYTDEIKKFRNKFTFHLGNAAPYAMEAISELAREMGTDNGSVE